MFPIGEQPEFIKDLNQFEEVPREIAKQGKTKNLERLKDLSGIEKLWLFSVNQEEFDIILQFVRPKSLYVYEMRVKDQSSLELLSGTETLSCGSIKYRLYEEEEEMIEIEIKPTLIEIDRNAYTDEIIIMEQSLIGFGESRSCALWSINRFGLRVLQVNLSSSRKPK